MFLFPATGDIDTASATECCPFTKITISDFFSSFILFATLIDVLYLSSPDILSVLILSLFSSFSMFS